MRKPIDLVVIEQERKAGGIGLAIGISFILHTSFIIWFVHTYKPMPKAAADVPMARYVELITQKPRQFVEAPGQKTDTKPLNAPLSDMNRKAAMPEPTGDKPTQRPGADRGIYQPPVNPMPRAGQSHPAPQVAQQARRQQAPPLEGDPPLQVTQLDPDRIVYHDTTQASAAATTVDWNKALGDVAKIASLGRGGDGFDLGTLDGGEKGFAEAGPLSFETQWYYWGPYAKSMVSRIRVNWYANMPEIIRTGMQGVVTIRFTIHRDGRISEVTILKSSGVPPYDFAARKAIELSSPLNPLPTDFPNPTERVTAMFYYNMDVPGR